MKVSEEDISNLVKHLVELRKRKENGNDINCVAINFSKQVNTKASKLIKFAKVGHGEHFVFLSQHRPS